MFALRSRHAGGDQRRLSVEQLSLGGDDVRLGGGPGVVLVLRDRQRTLIIFDGPGKQVLERIGLAKRYIGERERRLRGERGVCENGGVRLRAGLLRLDFAPNLAPDIQGPRPRGFRSQVRAARQAARRRASAVNGGKEPGARLVDERQRLTVIGLVRLDGLVGHHDDPHELVKLRIMKNGPPVAFRLVCARRGDLPALDLLELRRHDCRGAFKVRTDRRAAGDRNRGDKRRRPGGGQKLRRAPDRALACRPEAREQSADSRGLANPNPSPRDAGQVVNAQSDSEAPPPGRLALPNLFSVAL